jgi:hypothetical protein
VSAWFALIFASLAALVAASVLERPIKQAVRSRWPAFDYDSQLVLVLGAAVLGGAAMLAFLALAFFPS